MSVRFGLLTFLLIAGALGDLYLQSPRGSNDRLNEANTNRNNANRLFDSQNNAKGGYCYGPMMSFYEGSLLSVEWTNQHGCSNPKLYCNLVLQYMCGATTDDDSVRVRDGTTTNTIEDDPTTYNTKDANGDFVYGMHESYEFYQQCKTRERNMGLWISDREEEGGLSEGRRASVFTRQNNNGNRHGFECPEERDYYPYWQATPWRDIAVITDHPEWCDFYQTESQNVKGRNYCAATDGTFLPYIFQNDCTSNGGTWQSTESWGIAKPDCVQAPWGRDNQLGHALGGFNAVYNWTLPTSGDEKCIKEETCECVLRIRYNISSYDSINNQPYGDAMTDYKFNAANSPVFDDPIVDVKGGLGLKLALDTTQYGRTFQDRSYVFGIKPRPSGVPATARIWNLNVRGKRGNIVQTYPATEYDFVPQYLNIKVSDYVHFQWTGCDTNPAGNAGEGTDQTDRSNVVQMADPNLAAPASDDWLKTNAKMFSDDKLRVKLAYLGQTDCPTYDELLAKNNNNENQADQDPTNCHKLNAAPAYYDAGLVQFKSANTYHYMSTRNHNFTNRDQKGSLAVEAVLSNAFIAVAAVGGALFAASIGVAGAMFYAKSHPSSGVANLFNKM